MIYMAILINHVNPVKPFYIVAPARCLIFTCGSQS
jgi:hypothetical protein